jgi:hypothetical protein
MNHRIQSIFPEDLELDVLESDVIEIPLLLPGWQVSALETAAHARGVTAAEMVRHVLNDFLSSARCGAPATRRGGTN